MADALSRRIKSNNNAFRGYGVLECRPDELLCTPNPLGVLVTSP